MKKTFTYLAVFVIMASVCSPVLAASIPVPAEPASVPAATTPTTPGSTTLKDAIKEFRSLPRSERRMRIKESKKVLKEYRRKKRDGSDDDANTVLLVILAILLPPLAVYLKENELDAKFWISVVLTLLVIFSFFLWIIPVLYALLVVFDVF